MTLVIFGASGGVGRHLVEQSLARGHQVVAIYRNADGAPRHAALRTVALPSIRDLAPVAKELEAADVIFGCLGNRRVVGWNPWSRMGSPLDLVASHATALCARPCGV